MKILFRFLVLNFIAGISYSQDVNEYRIGQINDWKQFEILTDWEFDYHQSNEKSYQRIDSAYQADKLYLTGITEERKKFLYDEYELKNRFDFRYNRARYFVEYIEEDSMIMDKTFSMPGIISSECFCELKKDGIEIQMGYWVFGGFIFTIRLYDNHFELQYIEDAHESKPFKYSESDSLYTDELSLRVENASLTLMEDFKAEIGEQIRAYLIFESPEYFIVPNHRGYSKDQEIHKAKTKGKIYFTCKLRMPFDPPQRK